jgi:hypothetical protein
MFLVEYPLFSWSWNWTSTCFSLSYKIIIYLSQKFPLFFQILILEIMNQFQTMSVTWRSTLRLPCGGPRDLWGTELFSKYYSISYTLISLMFTSGFLPGFILQCVFYLVSISFNWSFQMIYEQNSAFQLTKIAFFSVEIGRKGIFAHNFLLIISNLNRDIFPK